MEFKKYSREIFYNIFLGIFYKEYTKELLDSLEPRSHFDRNRPSLYLVELEFYQEFSHVGLLII